MIAPGVDDVKISLQRFGWPDYVVFLLMLLSCIAIGIYFGFIEKKSKKPSDEEADYLVGGRTMGVFPISMSLIARLQHFSKFMLNKLKFLECFFFFCSFISGISLLGTPTEIYVYGTQYVFVFFGVISMGLAMTFIFLPVFHDLKLTSTYQVRTANATEKN